MWSFEKAREYCPNQILILNDYGIINDPNAINQYKGIINALKSRGLIDGVGIQSHSFNIRNMSAAQVKNNLDNLAQVDLPIHVTEMDIEIADDTQHRNKYAELFPVFWEHPAVVGVTLWGYRNSWLSDDALMIRDNQPRPALEWIESYFEQRRANR